MDETKEVMIICEGRTEPESPLVEKGFDEAQFLKRLELERSEVAANCGEMETPTRGGSAEITIDPNAFRDELQGKSLGEQVKFLKERGYTFRLISERLGVPMTNCYTAIKKLRLPKEYWERIKAEVRLRKRAIETVNDIRVAEMFASVPPQRRIRPGEELTENITADIQVISSSATNGLPLDMNGARKQGPICSTRKHLTLDDGRVVQHWREQGLTLQKIAHKLQMPMSSCYRAMKRYQVSQKAHTILQIEKALSMARPINGCDSRNDSNSTTDLLLGMLDASSKRIRWSPKVTAEGATAEITNCASLPNFSNGCVQHPSPSADIHFSRKRSHKQDTIADCVAARIGGSSGTESRKAPEFDSAQRFDHQLTVGGVTTATDLSLFSPRCAEGDAGGVPLSNEELVATVKGKLRWAATVMGSSTDPEEIVNLMKVISTGLNILKQFTQNP